MTEQDERFCCDAIVRIAREAIERHDSAEIKAAQIRRAQAAAGYPLDTRADYAEGSRDAYHVIGALIAGAMGAPNVAAVAGTWDHPRDIAPPVLPDGAGKLYSGHGTVRAQFCNADCGCAGARTIDDCRFMPPCRACKL